MVRVLGGLCIMCSGGMLLWLREKEDRRREDVLCDIIAVLKRMAEEIEYVGKPLPDLLEEAKKMCRREGKCFFGEIASALKRMESLSSAWKNAAERLPVSQEERRIIVQIPDNFNNSEGNICKTLELFSNMLENSRKSWKIERTEMKKCERALCLSTAALLVILLA